MGDYRPKIELRVVHQLRRMALLLAIVLFQTALAPSLWTFRLDWVLVAVICWTLIGGLAAGLRWALYGGVALDLLSPLPVGSHLLALLLGATSIALLTNGFPRDNRIVPLISVVVAALLYGACLGLVMMVTGRPVAWSRYPVTILLPNALADAAVALPVYFLLDRFQRATRPAIGWEI